MSNHINAKKSGIAKTVYLAGDPLRAKYFADNFLMDVSQFNDVRNMLGYTGRTLDGKKRISVMGSGMGIPSLGIYVHELINDYDVERIIRVGSAGSMQSNIKCRDIVLAQGSCTDSGINYRRFQGMTYAPIANWKLLLRAFKLSKDMELKVHVGNILATDSFYDSDAWKIFAAYNVLAIEMETTELYTQASHSKVEALSILTISDHLVTGEKLSAKERETTFNEMIKLALAI